MITFLLLAAGLAFAGLVNFLVNVRRHREPIVDRWTAAASQPAPVRYYGNYWAHLSHDSGAYRPGNTGAGRVPQRGDIPVQRSKGQREADHAEGRHQRGSHRPGHAHSRVS
jgi:hypothetical protein